MKKYIAILILGLISSFSVFARDVTLSQKAVIEKVNLENQTISMVGVEYMLSPETRVITKKNQLVSVSTLQKGTVIEFIMDDTQTNKKLITQIKILSDVPKDITNH
jgi:fructose-1,6-bisphosphatase